MCARGGIGRRDGFRWRYLGVTIAYIEFHSEKLLKYKNAPVAELADALDLGDATSVKGSFDVKRFLSIFLSYLFA